MYENLKTSLKIIWGKTEDFRVGVYVHQGSGLSSKFFSVLILEITKEIQGEVSWYMIVADNIILIGINLKKV